jgi:uncharacterized protein (TIGR02996 family)
MPVADAFIQTILQQPDADAPRLVYADWLEEQGDPLAELIRLQCESAHLATTDPRHTELSARAGTLREVHNPLWLAPEHELKVAVKFQRGLAEVGVSRVRTFLELAERLFALPWIVHAHVTDAAASLGDLAALAASPYFKRLQRLDLARSRIGNEGIRILCESKSRCKLTELNLNHNLISSRGLRLLLKQFEVRWLIDLRLYGNGIDSVGAQALAKCPHLGRLRRLDLADNLLRTNGAEYLAQAVSLNHLEHLYVQGNSIGGRGRVALRRRFGPRVRLGGAGGLL